MLATTSNYASNRKQRLWLVAVLITALFAVPGSSRGAAVCNTTTDLIGPLSSANNNAADTISLTAGCIYTLTAVNNKVGGPNGLPVIQDDGPGHGVTINGNGATIQRDPTLAPKTTFRIFHIASGASLILANVVLANGLAQGGDGSDAAGPGGAGGGGESGIGGGIYNAGTLILNTVTISNSQAFGGAGGSGLAGGDGAGGAGGGAFGGAGGAVGNPGANGGTNSGGGGGGSGAGGGAGGASGGGGGGSGNNTSFSINPGSGDSGGGSGGSGTNSGGGGGGGGGGLGGGIFNQGTLTINGATSFINNQSIGGSGGAGSGSFSSGENGAGRGGAIYNHGAGTLTINAGTLFRDNTAGSGGGGIYNEGTATVAAATFTNNTANGGGFYSADGGGAIANGAGTSDVTGSRFTGNSAPQGGALRVGGGTLNIAASTFSNNSAAGDYGGGALFMTDGTVSLTSSTFAINTAYEGGALASAADGGNPVLSVNSSTFTGNTASGQFGSGGAISSNGFLSVQGSTFAGNTTTGADGDGGGGIHIANGQGTITNSTFSDNRTTGGGGGIYNRASTVDVISVTIYGNAANSDGDEPSGSEHGGGIFSAGTTNLHNSIVAGNSDRTTAPASVHPDVSGEFASVSYNLIGDGTGSLGLANGVNGNQVGTSASPIDPLLSPLQNNGGPTATHLPNAGSPALDQGGTANCPATDQRGMSRPVDLAPANAARQNGCDIGAVEVASPGAPSVSLAPTSLNFGNQLVGVTSVARTVTLTNTGTAPLTISSITISGDFAQTSNCPVGTATLAPGARCTIDVTFTPTTTGARSAVLTIADNAAGSPRRVSLAGAGIRVSSSVFRTFLPLLSISSQSDLVVTNITLTPNKTTYAAGEPVQISVTIKNAGTAPSVQAFWVDLYINPAHPPVINDLWHNICGLSPCEGITWPIRASLAPGQSITLTSTANSYDPTRTSWHGWFANGTTTIYAYVDSWNTTGVVGAVAESDESNNRAALTGLVVTGQNPAVAEQTIQAGDPGHADNSGLPVRPLLSDNR